MAAAEPAAQDAKNHLLSIGQVLARLRGEFPDLSNSKLRFLEEQGLVSPSRTASGYRKFSAQDVERVRIVLALQRDRYLPLKVIRGYLDDRDAGIATPFPVADESSAAVLPVAKTSRAEALRTTGATVELLTEAISAGLIPAGDGFDEESVTMLAAVVRLHSAGIGPRHLRVFRQMAAREASLIESAVMPLSRRGDAVSRSRANEIAGDVADGFDVVRRLLSRRALSQLEL
ncbi:transcriptional regulator FtsR [Mycetocola reblochoni]|uniref:Transcriptional regulator, MerR family n=2 Tax=Mycetocola reblochoni TaxID=331618 RepID=A0A1R4IHE9_9MICO|nr:MerR family transcriptional regulator [Mycetocola reblochoni]RLP69642.1 MerR family transcriptional regulator [Mycetocola reblochoni]SJN19322.1 transcriptional regulator, MerR family [Mycetocola reblochoni REB411]